MEVITGGSIREEGGGGDIPGINNETMIVNTRIKYYQYVTCYHGV